MKKLILFIILLSESHSKQQMKRLIPLLTLLYLLASMNVAHAQVIDEDFITKHTYTDLTKALKNPEDVYGLDLSGQELTEFPKEIFQFKNLRILNLGYDYENQKGNKLTSLPAEIGKLTQLTTLDLSYNQLSSLPAEIGKLTQLNTLGLSGNQLSSLPNEIGKLTQLTYLFLSYNELSSFPAEIGKLTQLKALDLSKNQLSSFPAEIGKLTQLKALDLSSNQLGSLPAEIGKLTQLTYLDLSNNSFQETPSKLFPWLKEYDNGIFRLAEEIQEENTETNPTSAIMYYGFSVLLITIILLFNQRKSARKNKKLAETAYELEVVAQELQQQRDDVIEKSNKLEALTEELEQQNELITQQRDDVIEKSNELEALTEELRQQNEVVDMTNQALKATQDTKDLMISAVNHDLRNPLNPIINFSHPDYPGKTEKERLAAIHTYSGLMLKLINDIMQVYKADKLNPQISPSSLHHAAQEAIEVMSLAQTRMPKIINEIPVEMQAMFDASYIGRVFENFLSNAIKYTSSEEKGGVVKFTATPNVAEKTVCIAIQDNGKGIPKDKLEEIFLPFVNPDAKSIGGAKSVGIGLTFCKTVIEAHKTKIEVSSEVGKGTTFSFVLPYVLPESNTTQEGEEALVAVMLSEAEQAQVATHITQIKEIGFRNAKLKGYLEEMEVGEDTKLQTWKETLIKVIKTRNKKVFQEMMG
jgi:Leucine-rich repeat (LRR) protein